MGVITDLTARASKAIQTCTDALVPYVGPDLAPYALGAIVTGSVLSIAVPILSSKKKEKRNLPPAVPYRIPFIGSMLDFGLRPIDFLTECYTKYGECFTFVMFGRRMTYVMGPDGNHFFFNAKLAHVSAEEAYASLTVPVFGKDVVYDVENSILMEQKRMVKDALSTNAFRTYVPMFQEETLDYIKRWGNGPGTVDIFKAMSELIIMTASRSLLGKEIRSKLDETVAQLYHDLDSGFQPINFFFEWLPLPQYYARDQAQQKLAALFREIIDGRRAKGDMDNSDVLQGIMDSTYKNGEKMTDSAIANFMIAILMAGQHTSSTTSNWTLLYIANDPKLAAALLEEQSRVLTGKIDTAPLSLPPLNYDHIQKMPLLEMTIKESLRLRPPIFNIMRKVIQDIEYKGYIIPKGDWINSSPAVSALDPERFPDPLKFDPYRHLEAAPTGEWQMGTFDIAEKSARSHYLPFGAGRHRCIGEGFAYVQLKTVISTILRNYELSLPLNPDGTKRFPKKAELEKHDSVSEGKYTIGLGQTRMGFCDDREDINSICLTAVQNLMEKYNIPYESIGRMEVGTETITDKSKSTKTVLMTLFAASGNTNIEGVTTTNACYGGTNALFNAVNWIESSYWDGRYALVVSGDIAVYKEGNARPTGGAGCVAMLLGANAPIVFDRGLRASYMEHSWDFFKPDLSSEYPEVDGKLSVECYLRAVDRCYNLYMDKLQSAGTADPSIETAASHFLFHSPYTKLVQKSFARLGFNDFLRHPEDAKFAAYKNLLGLKAEDTYSNRDVEKAFVDYTKDSYKKKVIPSLLCAKEIGNMYCGSLYGGLASLISEIPSAELQNKRVILFSYGSGLASSMFSFTVVGDTTNMAKKLNVRARLASRTVSPPADYDAVMHLREETHQLRAYSPSSSVDETNEFPGTFFLERVDDKFRRAYGRTPTVAGTEATSHVINGVTY